MKHLLKVTALALCLAVLSLHAQPTSIQRLTSKNGTVQLTPAGGQGGTVDLEVAGGGGGGAGGTAGLLNPSYYLGSTAGSNIAFAVRTNWPASLVSNYVCTNMTYVGGPFIGYGHIQGAVKDTNNHVYKAYTTGLFMVSNNAAISNDNISAAILLASNTTAIGSLLDPLGHYGGVEWFNNKVYAVVENFTNENSYGQQTLAVFDSNLNFLFAQPATNLNYEVSGLCIVPTAKGSTNGVIFVTSYHTNNPAGTGVGTNGNTGMRMYDANSLAYLGWFPFATNATGGGIEHMQDVAWSPWLNRFLITANTSQSTFSVYECDLQGRLDTVLGSMSGVTPPYTFYFGMGDCTLEGVKCQSNELYFSFFGAQDGQCIASVSMTDAYSSTLDMSGNFTGNAFTGNSFVGNLTGNVTLANGASIIPQAGFGTMIFSNTGTAAFIFQHGANQFGIFDTDNSGFIGGKVATVKQIAWDATGDLTLAGGLTATGAITTGGNAVATTSITNGYETTADFQVGTNKLAPTNTPALQAPMFQTSMVASNNGTGIGLSYNPTTGTLAAPLTTNVSFNGHGGTPTITLPTTNGTTSYISSGATLTLLAGSTDNYGTIAITQGGATGQSTSGIPAFTLVFAHNFGNSNFNPTISTVCVAGQNSSKFNSTTLNYTNAANGSSETFFVSAVGAALAGGTTYLMSYNYGLAQ